MNKGYMILVAVAATFTASVSAQNLDPTVEVSRSYEGKLMEVHKPVLEMAVPDSVLHFDLDFDYTVFESPYKGTYEFSPYIVSMTPTSREDRARRFYLRAGAGYTLHPLLDVVWSPAFANSSAGLDVYASHKSYIGKYAALGGNEEWSGYDLRSRAGADFRYDREKVMMSLDAGYYSLAGKNALRTRSYDAVDVGFRIASKALESKNFMYDIRADWRFAEDKLGFSASREYLGENNLRVEAFMTPVYRGKHKVFFDAAVELLAYSGAFDTSAGEFVFVPRYVFDKGRFHIDAGIRLAAVVHSGNPDSMFATDAQVVYPDIKLGVDLIKNAMRMYLNVGGGNEMNTYSSLLARNHHADISYGIAGSPLLDLTVEKVSVSFGFKGRISDCFSYDVYGGYADYKNGLMDAAVQDAAGKWLPAVGYAPYRNFRVAAEWNLDMESFRFDGHVEYADVFGLAVGSPLYAPSAFSGNVALRYDWNRRIFVGADCAFATSRGRESQLCIPGYADVGMSVEYSWNRKLSFWLRGGNLLGMTIQRVPLYAEKGASFTLGVTLNL